MPDNDPAPVNPPQPGPPPSPPQPAEVAAWFRSFVDGLYAVANPPPPTVASVVGELSAAVVDPKQVFATYAALSLPRRLDLLMAAMELHTDNTSGFLDAVSVAAPGSQSAASALVDAVRAFAASMQ